MKKVMNHYLNPLHFVYRKLVEAGVPKVVAMKVALVYEVWIYNYLVDERGTLLR
jgi:hypothetical protein